MYPMKIHSIYNTGYDLKYPCIQDKQCTYKRKIEARLLNYCRHEKTVSITYSECVSVALVIQHAKRMRLIILSLWPVCLYHIFSHYLINGTIFGEKRLLNVKCVF